MGSTAGRIRRRGEQDARAWRAQDLVDERAQAEAEFFDYVASSYRYFMAGAEGGARRGHGGGA